MATINKKKKKVNTLGLLVKLVLIWLIVAFVLYPNLNLLVSVFYKNGEFSTDAFRKIVSSERAIRSLKNSFVLAFSMLVTVNVVGILTVLFTEYWEIKGAKLLRLGYMSPLVYGGVVLVTGYKFIYGSNGILTNLLVKLFPSIPADWFNGYWAVIFIMTFACTSNHIIFLTNAIRGLDYHTIEAAKNMGASGGRIFFQVVFPTLKPTFFAISILTFLTGLSAMSAPLIVGGPDFQTINPMIITFAKTPHSRELGALLAVILGIATILMLTVLNKVEKGGNYISISKTKAKIQKQKINSPVFNILAHFLAYFMFLIYMVPVVIVILFSFTESLAIKTGKISLRTLTLDNYASLFTKNFAIRPYLISFAYSFGAALIVTVIAIVVSRVVHKSKNKLDSFFEYGMLIPWLLPGTLVALGLMVTYDLPRLIIGNRVLIGTTVLMLIAYIIVELPFSFRMIKASFFSIDENLEEAAKCMGASTLYTMVRVIIPVIMPVVLSVIVLNFNGKLADYDLSVFLYHPSYQPLGIVVKSASDETASTDAQAMVFVYSVILMVISSLALYFGQGEGAEHIKKWIKRMRKNERP